MDNSILISVIMPAYNAGKYIAESIDSVLSQSYPHWELLVTDDCSTDDTREIVTRYSESDPRIKLFSTGKNTGSPSEPRNISIKQAKGDYLAFLDSDDIWLPQKLEEQLGYALNGNRDFIYSDYLKFTSGEEQDPDRKILAPASVNYSLLLKTNPIPCLTVFVKKSLFDDVSFPSTPKEDYAAWLKVLRKGIVAYNTGKVHARYRVCEQSRSSNKVKMIYNQWYILREEERVPFIKSCVCLARFGIEGYRKYRK